MKIRIKEAQQTPQAIFMAGPAGAGKSFVSKSLPLSKFQVINIDDTYEELLKAAGIGTKIKDFSPEELSQAAKLVDSQVIDHIILTPDSFYSFADNGLI